MDPALTALAALLLPKSRLFACALMRVPNWTACFGRFAVCLRPICVSSSRRMSLSPPLGPCNAGDEAEQLLAQCTQHSSLFSIVALTLCGEAQSCST